MDLAATKALFGRAPAARSQATLALARRIALAAAVTCMALPSLRLLQCAAWLFAQSLLIAFEAFLPAIFERRRIPLDGAEVVLRAIEVLEGLLWAALGVMLWLKHDLTAVTGAVAIWAALCVLTAWRVGGRARVNAWALAPPLAVVAFLLLADDASGMRPLPALAMLMVVMAVALWPSAFKIWGHIDRRPSRATAAPAADLARYEVLAEHASDLVLQTAPDGVIEYVSPASRQLGWEPAELVGRNAVELIHPEDRRRSVRARRAALKGRTPPPSRREFRVRRKDGGYTWMEASTTALRDRRGRAEGIFSLLRDVTHRRATEEDLRRKSARAEAASAAKSEFLATMSHEIRTPLTGIIGFAGLLEATPGLPGPAITYVDRIVTAGRTLLNVVNDVLDFAKLESGQVALAPSPFDPGAFVAETVELVRAQAEAKGLTLRVSQAQGFPAAVRADSLRLRQVLLNLLTNAIKFTDHGEVEISASYSDIRGGMIMIAVSDTGVGIADEAAARLFQRYSQVDESAERRNSGAGLGLAICKALIELMGGSIGVDSELGRGSRFWFTILAPPATPAAEPDAAEAQVPTGGGAKILVVDDVASNRELVATLLAAFDYKTTEAEGAAEAIRLAEIERFDLILMDLQMPGMDGFAAAREIRARSPLNRLTPIVALSANVLERHLEACQAAGMNDHIAKPIEPTELLSQVFRWAKADAPAG